MGLPRRWSKSLLNWATSGLDGCTSTNGAVGRKSTNGAVGCTSTNARDYVVVQ